MVVFLIDADNLSSAAWVDEAFNAIESSEGPMAVRRAYGSAENLKGLAEPMRLWAIRPFVNLSLSKNTTDMALAVDAMELACQTPSPKTVVIGSGDADFVPLVVRLRERGIKVLCVSEFRKMAPEAVKAYDSVIYVGRDAAPTEPTKVEKSKAAAKTASPASKKTPAKALAKAAAKKSPAAKKAAAKNPRGGGREGHPRAGAGGAAHIAHRGVVLSWGCGQSASRQEAARQKRVQRQALWHVSAPLRVEARPAAEPRAVHFSIHLR